MCRWLVETVVRSAQGGQPGGFLKVLRRDGRWKVEDVGRWVLYLQVGKILSSRFEKAADVPAGRWILCLDLSLHPSYSLMHSILAYFTHHFSLFHTFYFPGGPGLVLLVCSFSCVLQKCFLALLCIRILFSQYRFCVIDPRWSLRFCISSKLPGDADCSTWFKKEVWRLGKARAWRVIHTEACSDPNSSPCSMVTPLPFSRVWWAD